MKLKSTLIEVARGDVFMWVTESGYGKRALMIVDNYVDEQHRTINFVSCSGTVWSGSLCWFSELFDAGGIRYLGTIDNIQL